MEYTFSVTVAVVKFEVSLWKRLPTSIQPFPPNKKKTNLAKIVLPSALTQVVNFTVLNANIKHPDVVYIMS